jgi:hypothetical protein
MSHKMFNFLRRSITYVLLLIERACLHDIYPLTVSSNAPEALRIKGVGGNNHAVRQKCRPDCGLCNRLVDIILVLGRTPKVLALFRFGSEGDSGRIASARHNIRGTIYVYACSHAIQDVRGSRYALWYRNCCSPNLSNRSSAVRFSVRQVESYSLISDRPSIRHLHYLIETNTPPHRRATKRPGSSTPHL